MEMVRAMKQVQENNSKIFGKIVGQHADNGFSHKCQSFGWEDLLQQLLLDDLCNLGVVLQLLQHHLKA